MLVFHNYFTLTTTFKKPLIQMICFSSLLENILFYLGPATNEGQGATKETRSDR